MKMLQNNSNDRPIHFDIITFMDRDMMGHGRKENNRFTFPCEQ